MLAAGGSGQRRLKAVDTNVLARVMVRDDERQAKLADRVLADGVVVGSTVLLELGWLLASRYAVRREGVVKVMRRLIDLPTVHLVDVDAVEWVIDRYEDRGDFADLMHVATVADHADGFVTFDRQLKEDSGPETPVPVETLGI